MELWSNGMKEHTKRRNLNCGYLFDEFNQKHYEVENKLLSLIKSLQVKQNDGSWDQKIHEPNTNYENSIIPILHYSSTTGSCKKYR